MNDRMPLTDRLDAGPVICAEGFLFELERRGYLTAGEFVPEVALEYRRRLVGADAQEQPVFFAGKGRLLRTRDHYPILSAAAPDGDDDNAHRTGPDAVED